MADANRIEDTAVLGAYLETRIKGFSGLGTIRKFSDGQSNPTYLLSAQSGKYVLRAKPPGQLLKSAHQVDREFRVMAALAGSNVPVPEMLYLAPEDNPLGRMFFVMEYIEGRILWDPTLPDQDRAERWAIYDAMNAALAALHQVDPVAVGLADFGKPGNYFQRQTSRWIAQYQASATATNADVDRVMDWLSANIPQDDTAALVHGDYRLDNMILHPGEPRVLAVLDWELSTLGHPLADLAYQCMQWRLPHDGGMKGLGGIDRASLGIPTEQEYIAAYCTRRGIGQIENWSFYLVFSFFRLTAILQGVYKRALDGNASNPEKARRYGAAVPVLAAMAHDLLGEST